MSNDETKDLSSSRTVGPVRTRTGTTGSRYVVLEEIGRGGMGRVLRAYDPKLQREVALKTLHGNTLDDQATSRLVVEARAMAKLSHPNVVSVYDVQERPGGEVVLVMEYVAGQTLRAWLRAQRRDWPVIVEVFGAAGRGLAKAHASGLLHRDFKPSNVLVADDGRVKVTDFGLAKFGVGSIDSVSSSDAVSADGSSPGGSERPALTEAGAIMGTPRYMAPEQHRGETLTPAADQYAFCVALWEGLCGKPPFPDRALNEHGPPSWPKPSTPKPIVEAIVRGLSPAPDDRWPSMDALLSALSWSPARGRYRWFWGLAGVAVLGLGGAGVYAWIQARAQRCSGAPQQLSGIWNDTRRAKVEASILVVGRSYATQVWERTQRELDSYTDSWIAMYTEACEATVVRGEQSPRMQDLRVQCLARAAVELEATVNTLADSGVEVTNRAHKLVGGLMPLSRCADTQALEAEVEPPMESEVEAVEQARRYLARARSLQRAAFYEDAREQVESATQALVGVEYGPVQAELALARGQVFERLGQYEQSKAALAYALDLALQWEQRDVVASASRVLLYVVGLRQQRPEAALLLRSLVLGSSRGHPLEEAIARRFVAEALRGHGDYAEAEIELRAALSLWLGQSRPDRLEVAVLRNSLAMLLLEQGKYPQMEVEARAASSLLERVLGPEHPDVAAARGNVATALIGQGKYGQAETQMRAVRSLLERALGPGHPDVSVVRSNLGAVLQKQGKYEEAEAEYRQTLPLMVGALDPEHPQVAELRHNLALVLQKQGKPEEAAAEYRAALSLFEKVLGPRHSNVAFVRNNLANLLHEQGKHERAEAEFRSALSAWIEALGADHPFVADARSGLAAVLLDMGRTNEARTLAEDAWARRQQDDIPREARAAAAFLLAQILGGSAGSAGERAQALVLAEDALRSYAQAEGEYPDERREIEQWLEEHRAP
ncbi:MAG: serine/threonine-protein kinase [Myxococcota bacterium]